MKITKTLITTFDAHIDLHISIFDQLCPSYRVKFKSLYYHLTTGQQSHISSGADPGRFLRGCVGGGVDQITVLTLCIRKESLGSVDLVCVEVLRPSQPNGVMSSAVSLPNHTFTGQA